MDEQVCTLDIDELSTLDTSQQQLALAAIESGKVVYLPSYYYHLSTLAEENILSETILDGKHKNISYDIRSQHLGGFNKKHSNPSLSQSLKTFMHDYASFSKNLVDTLLPQYSKNLQWGRTSYRPAEIKGRASSKRKDDTRVHVDSFVATPVNGLRILRVFCNINPYGEPRVWHLGEPFAKVMQRFADSLPDYNSNIAKFLKLVKVTKTLRSSYDHYQLHLHDTMKLDDDYQNTVKKNRMDFPALSTWLVFTDHVSHAALSGQFLLEQTFYLPVTAMATPELSPLKYWEREKINAQA